jgi:hypothetical protein
MRHSTITLTMDAYGHLLPGAEADAADRLGAMVSLTGAKDDAEKNVVRMTGTDGGSAAQRVAQQSARDSGRKRATARDMLKDRHEREDSPNLLPAADLGGPLLADAMASESAPSWTRTMNLLIKSQLLCQLS